MEKGQVKQAGAYLQPVFLYMMPIGRAATGMPEVIGDDSRRYAMEHSTTFSLNLGV